MLPQAGYNPSVGSYFVDGWWHNIYAEDTFLVLTYVGYQPKEDTESYLAPECEQYTILVGDKIGRIDIQDGRNNNWKECVA